MGKTFNSGSFFIKDKEMPKNKDKEAKIREKAQKILDRAEILYDREEFMRAHREFSRAGNQYLELEEYRVAEECFLFSSKALVHEARYYDAFDSLRSSAQACIQLEDYQKAVEYYDTAAKNILKSARKDVESKSILAASFGFLCQFITGQHEKGIGFIKRIKAYVDLKEFTEHKLIRLVKGLTLAILNKDASALNLLKKEYQRASYESAESKLIRNALVVATSYLLLEANINLEKDELINEEILNFTLDFNLKPLHDMKKDKILKYDFKKVTIQELSVHVSDNLNLSNKPDFPLDIFEETARLPFSARANFPGKAFVGPINFKFSLDEKFELRLKTDKRDLLIKSPAAKLGIDLIPMENPIINQTFLMDVKVSNPSDADIVNIEVEFEFPTNLRLMRGTSAKKIYQLIRNENFTYQISLKALEPGVHKIKAIVSFQDADGNMVGPNEAELALDIKL
jgi:tetratricopeptide (TPR) repeat protein